MSSAEHEDGSELGSELQRLFDDERLGVRPPAGAEQAIVAGAARVRRRRTVVAASGGAFAIAALALGGITLAAKPSEPRAIPPAAPPASSAPAPPPAGVPPPPTPSSTTSAPASSTQPTTSSTSATGEATPSESAAGSSAPRKGRVLRGATLGPRGFGSLKLGMSVRAADASGVTLTGANRGGTCRSYKFSGSGVPGSGSARASADGTITTIAPSGSVHTPEGVGKGSTKDDVYAAYGGARTSGNTMTASAGSGASYVFRLSSGDGQVSGITLRSSGGC